MGVEETPPTVGATRDQDAVERRARQRSPQDNAATAFLEITIRSPQQAMIMLEKEARLGEGQAALALLEDAERIAGERGTSIRALAGAMRSRVMRHI